VIKHQDDGSHLTVDAPMFVAKLRAKGLVGVEGGLSEYNHGPDDPDDWPKYLARQFSLAAPSARAANQVRQYGAPTAAPHLHFRGVRWCGTG
jgi:hypothetical protein